MVYIKPSTRLRTDYSQIAELARRTGDAIYITKNGEKDLVVMCARAFELRDLVLKLSNVVLESENTRLNGAAACALEEFEAKYRRLLAAQHYAGRSRQNNRQNTARFKRTEALLSGGRQH